VRAIQLTSAATLGIVEMALLPAWFSARMSGVGRRGTDLDIPRLARGVRMITGVPYRFDTPFGQVLYLSKAFRRSSKPSEGVFV
jgi:hypothetical protein